MTPYPPDPAAPQPVHELLTLRYPPGMMAELEAAVGDLRTKWHRETASTAEMVRECVHRCHQAMENLPCPPNARPPMVRLACQVCGVEYLRVPEDGYGCEERIAHTTDYLGNPAPRRCGGRVA